MLGRLNDAEATSLLASQRIGRLGCITDAGPYVVPVSYYFSEGSVYSHSLPGLKIDALRKDPRACLQVDVIESELRWQSVLAFGTYEEVQARERSEVMNRLLQYFPMLTPVESSLAVDGVPLPIIVFKIKIAHITGLAEE